jgi:hypothetical protein
VTYELQFTSGHGEIPSKKILILSACIVDVGGSDVIASPSFHCRIIPFNCFQEQYNKEFWEELMTPTFSDVSIYMTRSEELRINS